MKLPVCLMLVVVAAASADKSFYQPTAQSAPGTYPSSYNYYEYPPQKEGWLDRLLGSNRRQGLEDIFGGLFGGLGGIGGLEAAGPIFGVVFAGILVVILISTVAYIGTALSSSGRGLDSDTWEVDHSVWVDQLQKDFEDSWSEQ